MKPYGLIKRIKGFVGKRDYHCRYKNHKIGSWWESYTEYVSRTSIKKQIKREIDNELKQ